MPHPLPCPHPHPAPCALPFITVLYQEAPGQQLWARRLRGRRSVRRMLQQGRNLSTHPLMILVAVAVSAAAAAVEFLLEAVKCGEATVCIVLCIGTGI